VNLRNGEEFVARGIGEATFRLKRTDGPAGADAATREIVAAREIAAHGVLVVDGLRAPGLYRLERDGAPPLEFGVNDLDAAESDLRTLKSGHRPSSLDLAEIESTFTASDFGLLAIALALLLADWIFLARLGRPGDGAAVAGARVTAALPGGA